MTKFSCALVAAALSCGVAAVATAQVEAPPATQPSSRSEALVGKAPPDFDLQGAVKGAKRLSDLKGQVVVLVFHGEFCPPSRKAMQLLADMNQNLSSPFQLIVANPWDTPEKARAEMAKLNVSAPVVCDASLADLYHADAIPLIVYIGTDGKITRTSVGYEGESMAVKVDEAVSEAARGK